MIFGIGAPRFIGTGTPDGNSRVLSNSIIEPSYSEPRILEHQSAITGKINFIDLGYYANFKVFINLHKYGDPGATFTTLMTYLFQEVIFFPHIDGASSGDTLGIPIGKDTATISAATKADPCSITATAHGFTTGDQIWITGVAGMTELNSTLYTITRINDNTFTLADSGGTGINSTGFTTYTSGGTALKIVPYFISNIRPYYMDNRDSLIDLMDMEFRVTNYVDITGTLQ